MPSGGPAALEITASPHGPLADAVCEGSLTPHSLLTPAPGHSLGAPRGKPIGWGCAWLSLGVSRLVLPGATHTWPQA